MISVLILTRNEEDNLPLALASVSWSDDIHVFDSESTDRTVEVARSAGATVTTRRFDSYARQRNAALQLPFRHPWVFILDADERPTPALSAEMQQVVQRTPDTIDGYRMRRRDFLWGTWLKHAQMTPLYIRLVRVGRARYTRDINEVLEVDGAIADLAAPLDHFPFSKGISQWIAKHNTYSTMEAELLSTGDAVRDASFREAFFARNLHERRIAQKAIFYKLPGRPLVKWFYMMFVRGAVLDGRAGIAYATLQSIYEYFIELKRRERIRERAGLSR